MSRVRTAAVLVLVMLGSAAVTQAQSNAEVNAGVQFDFSLPGARSLSLGGAFVAVAEERASNWMAVDSAASVSSDEFWGDDAGSGGT